MKSILLSIALVPLLLTGCATSGYVSDYPGYYGPGYYGSGYYSGPVVGVSYYNSGYYSHNYHNNYHHYASNYNHAYASSGYHGGYHSHTNVASSGGSHMSGGHHTSTASRSVHMGGHYPH